MSVLRGENAEIALAQKEELAIALQFYKVLVLLVGPGLQGRRRRIAHVLNARSDVLHVEVFAVRFPKALGLGFGVVFLYHRVDPVAVDIIALGGDVFKVGLLQIAQRRFYSRAEAIVLLGVLQLVDNHRSLLSIIVSRSQEIAADL